MSLHKFAEQVAANGRGDDSLLVHMTPDEVRKLQQFAEANGTTLTINPETGLPEAGLLSDLFKTVAPIALGAFLGPAGAAFGGGLMSAGMAGLTVGGLTTLATGSLSRGLMAGLGAYGGAGLGAGLETAGLQAEVAAGLPTVPTEGLAQADIPNYIKNVEAARGAAIDKFGGMSLGDKLSSGIAAAADNPMNFAKQNFGNIAAAAAPIMAGAMVPTTTKMPENTNPAYIRQKLYDPYTQTYKSLTPVKASEWGSRNFSDAYTNPQTGIAATLDERKPTPMAAGGIVALAAGGYTPTDAEIFKYFQTPNLSDTQIAADMQKFGVSAADIARATGTQNQQADYEKRFVQAVNTPATSAQEFQTAASTVGLQNQALEDAMAAAGMSQAAQYAATHALPDTSGVTGTDFYSNIGYKAGALPGDQGGLEGLYANINYAAQGLQNQIAAGKMTGQQAREAALNEMMRSGTSVADLKAATGKSLTELFPDTKVKPPVVPPVVTPPTPTTITPPLFTGVIPDGSYGSGPATGVDYKGNTVSIATPGDIITNPDGTRTVTPNIPGRQPGGFTGMEQVKSVYTAGGGSLGYKSPAPRTIAEFNQLYNKQTGDSLAAYDYLMGKGAGTAEAAKYPIQSKAAATGINRPYWTDTMRYKPKFLSYGKDGEIKSSTTSGKTADEKAADLTKAKTIEVVDSSGYDTQTYTAVLQEDGTYLAGNGKRYDVTGKELAADGGMMGYAMGGGLGSLGSYSDGGRLLKGPGDGVSDSIPATIGAKRQPARLADGEFVIPARIVSELGNGSTDAGAKKLYAMMDRVQRARGKTTGKNKVAANSRADKHLPA